MKRFGVVAACRRCGACLYHVAACESSDDRVARELMDAVFEHRERCSGQVIIEAQPAGGRFIVPIEPPLSMAG